MGDEDEVVTITTTERTQLLRDSAVLSALQAAGVDNWEWYGDAIASVNSD